MKKTIISTYPALAGSAFGAFALSNQISVIALNNKTLSKHLSTGILANAIQVNSDSVRVIIQLNDAPMAQFSE